VVVLRASGSVMASCIGLRSVVFWAGLRLSFLVRPSLAPCSAVIVSLASGAVASVALALAVSLKEPASRSAWVILWTPVQVIDLQVGRAASGVGGVHLKGWSAGE